MEYHTLLRIEKKIDTLQECVDALNYAMKEDERRAGIERWKAETILRDDGSYERED